MASGISSRPWASSAARSTLIAVALVAVDPPVPRAAGRSRSGSPFAATHACRYAWSSRTSALTADRTVAGHDHVGEVGDHVERVGPHRGVTLERERCHAEEAEVAGEAHVDVGDEHDEVARGVAARR